ncbi:MAG: PEP-CTERM sorting domain-containing protein [Cyanobacteria bacterium P01_G01_bin.49]
MNCIFSKRTASECVLMAIALLLSVCQAQAATIFASGQRLIPALPGVHDDLRENFIYVIDSSTGIATSVSPETTGLPPALAGTVDQKLLGFASGGQLVEIDSLTANLTPIGSANGLTSTGFDILDDQRGFLIPFDSNFNTQQIHALDLDTGIATPKGSATEVGDAINEIRGTPPGTAEPFVISLGSVENQLYGVDLDTDSLINFNPETGEAAVVGSVGAVTSGDRSIYSGFAALTGVDTNQDGSFDTLFGNVNFIDSDNDPDTLSERLGGVARYNLTDGTWELVGTNPGVIFFGFASSPTSVPEPGFLFGIITVSLFGIWAKRNVKE